MSALLEAKSEPSSSAKAKAEPELDYIKPDSKIALTGTGALPFEACLGSGFCHHGLVKVTTALGGQVTYLDNVLTQEECAALCAAMDTSSALSFWSEAGRENANARAFRDADTIELQSPVTAAELWRRVSDTLAHHQQHVEDCQGGRDIVIADGDEDDPRWERELPGAWQPVAFNHDLLLARYPCGGAFAPHTDGRATHDFNRRSFDSAIIFLNDIPPDCGGGTRFYSNEVLQHLQLVDAPSVSEDGTNASSGKNSCGRWSAQSKFVTLEVQPRAGRVLLFDQSLVHEGVPPQAPHTKHIIRSDVMYARRQPLLDSPSDQRAYALFREAEALAEAGDVVGSIKLFGRAIKMSPDMAVMMGHA